MKKILSVYFASDRTYLALTEPKPKGLQLSYVNSTTRPVNFTDDPDAINGGIEELNSVLEEIGDEDLRISVTIPSDNVLVSRFPGREKMSTGDLRQLVNLEIRQNYPQFNFEDFTSNVVPLAAKIDGTIMILAIIIAKQDLESCRKALKSISRPISKLEISQMNAHSAFLYNYPDRKDKNIALVGLQNGFADISVIKSSQPVYYNLAAFSSSDQIGEVIEAEHTIITSEYVENIDAVYLFGSGLTKEILTSAWETAMLLGMEAEKLNAFRMMSADLSQREKEYCSRVSHIFPPCIGGCILPYHERIKLY